MSKIRCNFVDSCRMYQYNIKHSDFYGKDPITKSPGVHGNSHSDIIQYMKPKTFLLRGTPPPNVPYRVHFSVTGFCIILATEGSVISKYGSQCSKLQVFPLVQPFRQNWQTEIHSQFIQQHIQVSSLFKDSTKSCSAEFIVMVHL